MLLVLGAQASIEPTIALVTVLLDNTSCTITNIYNVAANTTDTGYGIVWGSANAWSYFMLIMPETLYNYVWVA